MHQNQVPAQSKWRDTAVAQVALPVHLQPQPPLPPALTMNSLLLQDGGIPGIQLQLQLQEVKRGKASQFFGLMGKRVGGE